MNLNAFNCILRVIDIVIKRIGIHVHSSSSELVESRNSIQSGKCRWAFNVCLVVWVSDSHPDEWISESYCSSGKVVWICFYVCWRFVYWNFPNSCYEFFISAEQIHNAPSIRNVLFTRSILLNWNSTISILLPCPKSWISFGRNFSWQVLLMNLRSFTFSWFSQRTWNLNFKKNDHIWMRDYIFYQMLWVKNSICKILMFKCSTLQIFPLDRSWSINKISISVNWVYESALSIVCWQVKYIVPFNNKS